MNNINQEIEDLEATLVSLKAKAKAQEPTLTPVSFKSKGELAKALIDGRTFKTSDYLTLMYEDEDDGNWSSPFRVMQDGVDNLTMLLWWDSYDNLQEINAAPAEPWYLNIPEGGVVCYVSDDNHNHYRGSTKVRVVRYDTSVRLSFRSSNHIGWKYATPVNEGART
jgi:hypothetical protein|tara:strand:- start:2219 stop:2716 length:498 start_codon:yes stop_codon:yes gene_type:complete